MNAAAQGRMGAQFVERRGTRTRSQRAAAGRRFRWAGLSAPRCACALKWEVHNEGRQPVLSSGPLSAPKFPLPPGSPPTHPATYPPTHPPTRDVLLEGGVPPVLDAPAVHVLPNLHTAAQCAFGDSHSVLNIKPAPPPAPQFPLRCTRPEALQEHASSLAPACIAVASCGSRMKLGWRAGRLGSPGSPSAQARAQAARRQTGFPASVKGFPASEKGPGWAPPHRGRLQALPRAHQGDSSILVHRDHRGRGCLLLHCLHHLCSWGSGRARRGWLRGAVRRGVLGRRGGRSGREGGPLGLLSFAAATLPHLGTVGQV